MVKEPRTTLDNQLRGAAVDEEGSYGHGGCELEGFPSLLFRLLLCHSNILNARQVKGDGVILDAGFGFGAKAGAFGNELYQFTGNGNFAFRLLAERYADGIANALSEQSANTHSTLDAAVLAFTGFGNAEMQGVVHVLSIHRLHQQTHGGDHHDSVRGLDGNHDVVEVLSAEDAQELHTTLDDTLGCIAVARHDAVGERTVIHTDTHGGVMLLTDIDKRHELGLNLLQFLGIFLVGVFQMFEGTAWVDVVAGIDADLLAVLCSDVSGMCREMNVGHQWCIVAVSLQSGRDILHVLRFASALSGETHQFTTSINDALGLSHASLSVVRVRSCHRLDTDGVIATDGDITYVTSRANSSCTHTSLLLSPCLPFQSWP